VEYCGISDVALNVTVYGRVKLSAMIVWGKGKIRKIAEQYAEGNDQTLTVAGFRLEDLPKGGAVYLEAEAISDTAYICGGRIETEPAELKRVKVAAIVCTYKREEYVYRNIEKMGREVWD